MTKKFLCVQGSPEIPKGSEVRKNGDMYDLYINGKRYETQRGTPVDMYPWQIEGNDCWEEVKEEAAGRWRPERGTFYYYVNYHNNIFSHMWSSDDTDNALLEACNVYRTEQEAQEEVKRRESIANAWWPDESFDFYLWDFLCKEAVRGGDKDSFTSYAYIGACHKTKEACEEWGKTYGHLFDKRPKHGER